MQLRIMDTPFELQHLEYVAEFGETLFLPVNKLRNCCVNCVLDGNWVHCGKVLKATWSGELSVKRATVFYYNTGVVHINVKLNWTMRLMLNNYFIIYTIAPVWTIKYCSMYFTFHVLVH